MCTINISLDDRLLNAARVAFPSEDSLRHWLEEQLTALLKSKANDISVPERRPRKHDSLMGIINDPGEIDYRRIHLREKYGV